MCVCEREREGSEREVFIHSSPFSIFICGRYNLDERAREVHTDTYT